MDRPPMPTRVRKRIKRISDPSTLVVGQSYMVKFRRFTAQLTPNGGAPSYDYTTGQNESVKMTFVGSTQGGLDWGARIIYRFVDSAGRMFGLALRWPAELLRQAARSLLNGPLARRRMGLEGAQRLLNIWKNVRLEYNETSWDTRRGRLV